MNFEHPAETQGDERSSEELLRLARVGLQQKQALIVSLLAKIAELEAAAEPA